MKPPPTAPVQMTIPALLLTLSEKVQDDPVLQERLFQHSDTESLIAEVLWLAERDKLPLSAEDIRKAMDARQRDWIERRLP